MKIKILPFLAGVVSGYVIGRVLLYLVEKSLNDEEKKGEER